MKELKKLKPVTDSTGLGDGVQGNRDKINEIIEAIEEGEVFFPLVKYEVQGDEIRSIRIEDENGVTCATLFNHIVNGIMFSKEKRELTISLKGNFYTDGEILDVAQHFIGEQRI